ncbi:MAG: DUF1365 domain-containing protein [bacterium]|nr:DUF1365 domain-containing protein [bacterium]
MVNTKVQSAIYVGQVTHNRLYPRKHRFTYSLFMLYLDLSELNQLFSDSLFFSVRHRAFIEFRRSDFHGDPKLPLDVAIRDTVEKRTGKRPQGAIRMLAHLRYFGYCFNPVVFYYCFAEDNQTVECILAEVNNTPWNEKYAYILPIQKADRIRQWKRWKMPKSFHVSPFMPMTQDYDWRFTTPSETIQVYMANYEVNQLRFNAFLNLKRHPITQKRLLWSFLTYPLMTLKVIGAIYWEAFRLWWKKMPFYPHPKTLIEKQGNIL